MNSEIRKDYIQEKYVIIAPRRGKRPRDFEILVQKPGHPSPCVFCPNHIESKLIIEQYGEGKNWQIMVLKNKFPAVTFDNPRAYGVQEVIVETPDPSKQLEEFPKDHIAKLLKVYSDRTEVISKNKRIEYILIFKNNGGRAGASLSHAHSQIFATQFLPPHLLDKSQQAQKYKLKHGTCVYCDVVKKERVGPRFIWEDDLTIAFCPLAPMHNYELWIMPKRHLDNITALTDVERQSFAAILRRMLKKIGELRLPYNYYFHQVIRDEDQHLYLKITPRGSVWAGVEIGSGVVINPISPEDAATFYRNIKKPSVLSIDQKQ